MTIGSGIAISCSFICSVYCLVEGFNLAAFAFFINGFFLSSLSTKLSTPDKK